MELNIRALVLVSLFFSFAVSADNPVQSRELQLVWVKDGYQIGIDNDPAWQWYYSENSTVGMLDVVTPDLYYPPTAVTVRAHKGLRASEYPLLLKKTAHTAIVTSLSGTIDAGAITKNDLISVEYESLIGYGYRYEITENKKKYENYLVILRNTSGQVFSLTASTPEGKLNHVMPALDRMWNNIHFIDKKFSGSN